MLTAVVIKSSSVQNSYYLSQDGGYYIKGAGDTALYQWHGQGAARLGLQGGIDKKGFAEVFDGRLPGNITLGKRNADGSLAGRPGYDLTFSLNKDLSLIICCTEDKALKDYFLDAHLQSVKTTLNEVEKLACARKTEKGQTRYELTDNLVAAMCTHFSSRAGDPQVHTHACIANVTQRADGHWRALASDMQRQNGFFEKVRDRATYFGAIYQNEMAVAAKNKGFDVSPVNQHGMFEVTGFPASVRAHFSKRRKQIETIVNSLDNAESADKNIYEEVARHSRVAKTKLDKRDFMNKAKQEMAQLLVQQEVKIDSDKINKFDDIVQNCLNLGRGEIPAPSKTLPADENTPSTPFNLDARTPKTTKTLPGSNSSQDNPVNPINSIELNTGEGRKDTPDNQKNHFTPTSIEAINDAVDYLSTFSVSLDANAIIEQAINFNLGNDSITTLQSTLSSRINDGTLQRIEGGRFTTHELLAKERHLLTLARGAGTSLSIVNEPASPKQKQNMLESLVSRYESDGKRVRLLTQSNSLASQHNAHIRRPKMGLWASLQQLGRPELATSLHGFLHQYDKSTSSPIANWLAGKDKDVLMVDDSQRLSMSAATQLIELANRREAKVVFLRFNEGLRSPLAGNALSILDKAGVTIEPVNTVDVKPSPPRDIPCNILEVKADINDTRPMKQQRRHEQTAREVVKQHGDDLTKVAVYATSQDNERQLTKAIRDELKAKALLGQDSVDITAHQRVHLSSAEKKHAKFFKVGMVAKTYVGRGQFAESTINKIDLKRNQIMTKGLLGVKRLSPQQFLSAKAELYQPVTLRVREGELLSLQRANQISKQLGLSLNTRYQVSLLDKKVVLTPIDSQLKTITTRLSRLQKLDIDYGYVNTLSQLSDKKHSGKPAVLDAPAYKLSRALYADVARQHASLTVVTDSNIKAQKRLGIELNNPVASDLTLAPLPDKSRAEQAVDYAVSVLSSREAAFEYRLAVEKAMSYQPGKVGLDEIKQVIQQSVTDNHLHTRRDASGEWMLVTDDALKLETRIIEQIKSGQEQVTPLMDEKAINSSLASSRLTAGQQAACRLLATTNNRFVMVQGYAGTGKSTMLNQLKAALIEYTAIKPSDIIALAPTHKAVKALQDNGLEAKTLKQFLVDNATLANNDLSGKLILLDESSMVSNRDFADLQDIVIKAEQCHCAYIGDIAQLSPVEAGKPSELAYIAKAADMRVATMDEVLRQKNPALKQVAISLMDGKVGQGFSQLDNAGFIHEIKDDAQAALAKHYIKMDSPERHKTVIAVATNARRKKLNTAIRHEMTQRHELTGPSISLHILEDSRLTDAELRHSRNHEVGQVIKCFDDYSVIKKVNHQTNTLILQNDAGQQRAMNLSAVPENFPLESFKQLTIPVQKGDTLKWNKSDASRDVKAHQSLTVLSVDKAQQHITVKTDKGETQRINTNLRQNQHIDYQYVSTVHGLQGATEKNCLIYIDSENSLSNTQRLLYVAATRATHQAIIYTPDKSGVIKQISENPGLKTSALESMGQLERRAHESPPKQPNIGKEVNNDKIKIKQKNSRPATTQKMQTDSQKPRLDAKDIEAKLQGQVKDLCETLLGEPNHSLSNATHWRYGRKGSLSVNVGGEHQGFFNNFESGDKGGMLQLIMNELGMDFKSALAYGAQILGNEINAAQPRDNRPKAKTNPQEKQKAGGWSEANKQAYRDKLISRSKPIPGTLAEKYLNGRSISNTASKDLRFIKRISTGKGNKETRPTASALLAIARDSEGRAQAIQTTYLHPVTGDKLKDLPVAKRTIGSLHNASVMINNPNQAWMTFAAEGIETALSINDAMTDEQRKYCKVIAVLGKSNFVSLAQTEQTKNIVLVLDNDKIDWQDDKAIQRAINAMEASGKQVKIMQPDLLNNQKTDYNDLAQAGKNESIRYDIDKADMKIISPQTKQEPERMEPKATERTNDREI